MERYGKMEKDMGKWGKIWEHVEKYGKMWENMEKQPFFWAATAGLGKYCSGSYGQFGINSNTVVRLKIIVTYDDVITCI